MYKSILVVCVQALLIQSAFSACAGIGAGWGLNGASGYNGLAGYGPGAGASCGGVASTGGGLPISSASLSVPVGLSILSENVYEGTLFVNGNLPFLGTVGLEGVLPTAGAGAVSYGCGNGAVGIAAEEGPIVTGIAAPGSYGPGVGALGGLGYGLGGAIGYGAGSGGIGYGAGRGGIGGYGVGGIGNSCGCRSVY